jgi:DNA-directed RNA polymerase subunit L
MEVKMIKSGKDEVELTVDSITVAEVLRVYLNEQGIKFAAWREEHPTKPITFKIQSSGKTVKKAISDAVSAIKKDSELIVKTSKKK